MTGSTYAGSRMTRQRTGMKHSTQLDKTGKERTGAESISASADGYSEAVMRGEREIRRKIKPGS